MPIAINFTETWCTSRSPFFEYGASPDWPIHSHQLSRLVSWENYCQSGVCHRHSQFCHLILFLIKFAFIVGLGALQCDMWLVYANTISTILVLLFVCGAVLNFVSYVQSKLSTDETLDSPITNNTTAAANVIIETRNVEWIEFSVKYNLIYSLLHSKICLTGFAML